jgi:hypothetical protein
MIGCLTENSIISRRTDIAFFFYCPPARTYPWIRTERIICCSFKEFILNVND